MMRFARPLARRFCMVPVDRASLEKHGISTRVVHRNLGPAKYYEKSITIMPSNPGTAPSCVTNTGAYAAYSGEKTGRSPLDKRIVEPDSKEEGKKLFDALSAGGNITMPLQDMFWGAYFGSLTDRFGVQWMLNCAARA